MASFRRRAAAPLTFGTLIAAGLIPMATAPPAHADPSSTDIAYVELLSLRGIEFPTPQDAITAGRMICNALGEGSSYDRAVEVVYIGSRGWPNPLTPDQSTSLVSAAVAAYCPEYEPLLPVWAR